MKHSEIEQRELIDGYVRKQLADKDRLAFEEHFFECDDCFAQVQTVQRLADGVRHAAETELLGQAEHSSAWRPWLGNIFLAAAAALLMSVTGWYALRVVPKLQLEAKAHHERTSIAESRATALAAQLAETQTALNRIPAAQPNLPLVMLEASRAAAVNELKLPAAATFAALWIEVPPSAGYKSYKLEISTMAGTVVETLDGLIKNPYGALAVSVSAGKLPAATYKAKLYGGSSIVAEYRLAIRR